MSECRRLTQWVGFMKEREKVGFFDLKSNLAGGLAVVVIVTVAGWWFGFNWRDVADVARRVVTSAKPSLPVEVGYRKSMIGQGYVVVIKNISPQSLAVQLDLRDSRGANKKQGSKNLLPDQIFEIGWLEGWEFKAGDVIKISKSEYQTGVYTIE